MNTAYRYEVQESTEAIFASRLGGRSVETYDYQRRTMTVESSGEARIYPFRRNEQQVSQARPSFQSSNPDHYPYNRYSGSPDGKDAMKERCRR